MKRTQKSQKRTKFLFILIILTAILSITATYAWFSTQREVEISNMRLNVEVAESMQISLDGNKWTQSIQIADMRQFYGSFGGTAAFPIFQANPIGSADSGEGNSNYVPTELLPVSSAGQVKDGKLLFVFSEEPETDPSSGKTKLINIKACSEADLDELDTTISDRQSKTGGGNKAHPYLVFDMYLRNVSARNDGTKDPLKLNAGSNVWINTSSSDDDQEGIGVANTGLEYSTRVGFVIYGNTLPIAAEDTGTQTVAEQVRALAANGSETAVIWEPNDLNHTNYVVSNNGRGITQTSQAITTYAISHTESAGTFTAPTSIADVNETSGDNLVAPQTMKPAYTLGTGINEGVAMTNVAGAAVGIEPNAISRVRVYVWLEGQDPDCVDMASTGDKVNITIKLDRDAFEVESNTYVD